MIQDVAVRELIEEAQPACQRGPYSPQFLKDCITGWHVFGDPKRSARGRVITTAYLFGLPFDDEVTVTAGDDAAGAGWHAINSLNPAEFFEDHHNVIQAMAYSM